MCLKAGNSLEKKRCDLPSFVKSLPAVCSQERQEFSAQKKSDEEEVESWEELLLLLEKPDELSKDTFLNHGESLQTMMTNILEISSMPSNICEEEIYNSFDSDQNSMIIKWVNPTKAQLCFLSEEAATKAYFKYLSSSSSIGTLLPLPPNYHSIHSSTSSTFTSRAKTPLTVFHKSTFLATLEQSKYPALEDKRPLKTSTVAKRIITSVLGTRALRTEKEKEYDEIMIRQFIEALKEKEAHERLKEEIWEK
ncbi:hypothetical protein PORY_002267 [Pneumocystis oryctolagi]|uniref:Uncharacterized protein n=1 Tax=Pneumocystis oryctolagi TaxID=42067 RepID=A0ACB7C9B9_9ASCO|nr:hypothetical protein PORY_002267 [Pneumocystis oryctolagi]